MVRPEEEGAWASHQEASGKQVGCFDGKNTNDRGWGRKCRCALQTWVGTRDTQQVHLSVAALTKDRSLKYKPDALAGAQLKRASLEEVSVDWEGSWSRLPVSNCAWKNCASRSLDSAESSAVCAILRAQTSELRPDVRATPSAKLLQGAELRPGGAQAGAGRVVQVTGKEFGLQLKET